MARQRVTADELAFAAEGMAATAAAAALRNVRSLADHAPAARMFDAITTLIETSQRITHELVAAGQALDNNAERAASIHLAGSIGEMSRLSSTAAGNVDTEEMPDFLRRKR